MGMAVLDMDTLVLGMDILIPTPDTNRAGADIQDMEGFHPTEQERLLNININFSI